MVVDSRVLSIRASAHASEGSCQACGQRRPAEQLVRGRRPFPALAGAYEHVSYCIDRRFCAEAFLAGPDLLEDGPTPA